MRGAISIKARILGILGVLAVGYLLLLAMVQFTASDTHQRMDQVSHALFPAALKMQEAEAAFELLKKRYQDAVMLEDPAMLAAADKDANTVATALAAVRLDVEGSPELAKRADDLIAAFSSVHDRSRSTYGAMLASKESVGGAVQAHAAALARDDGALSSGMQGLDQSLADDSRDELRAIDLWSIRSRATGWIMLLIALAGCSFAWWVLQYKVLLPLEQLARRMKGIAEGDGDLTGRVEVAGRTELDEVGRWFNVFIERVEQIVVRVTENALSLANAAEELTRIARETASQSALQQEQATSITRSMGEISSASRGISDSTQKAAQDAREAEQSAHSGGETIHATVATMQELLVCNTATASKIEELGGASNAIGRIISVIDEIANQTNLLALNAAIEAARAGEHGRGFAVVAGEVRRLAERTRDATKEIDQSVRTIQGGTTEVVEAMRSNMRHVQIGVSSAQSAGDALASIIQGTEAVQKRVTQIAGASTEQSHATHSVNANLNEIASIIERTTKSSARAVEACDRLSQLAANLNELVGAFKVRGGFDEARAPQEMSLAGPVGTFGNAGLARLGMREARTDTFTRGQGTVQQGPAKELAAASPRSLTERTRAAFLFDPGMTGRPSSSFTKGAGEPSPDRRSGRESVLQRG